jgi:hypothetical protein
VEGMLKLVQGGKVEAANDTRKHQGGDSGQAHSQAHAPVIRLKFP